MSTDQQNLYEIIGLPQDSGRDLIEEQCIRLGDQYRPDKNSGDLRAALMFAKIERAYQTLVDPVKRAAYDAELHSGASAQGAALVEVVSAGVTLHSKINSWIAMLFLLVVFKILSDLLSRIAASWLQTQNVGAMNVATVGAIAGVAAAFVGTVIVGRLLAGLIPLWPPLSGILRTRGAAEITQGNRILATLAMLILVPVVLVGGSIAAGSHWNGLAGFAGEDSGSFSVLGLGGIECSEYLAYRQRENTNYDGATARVSAEWALGYISGYNSATSGRLANGIPVTTVVAYIDKYCHDHPLSTVVATVGCLHANFGGPPLPYCK